MYKTIFLNNILLKSMTTIFSFSHIYERWILSKLREISWMREGGGRFSSLTDQELHLLLLIWIFLKKLSQRRVQTSENCLAKNLLLNSYFWTLFSFLHQCSCYALFFNSQNFFSHSLRYLSFWKWVFGILLKCSVTNYLAFLGTTLKLKFLHPGNPFT